MYYKSITYAVCVFVGALLLFVIHFQYVLQVPASALLCLFSEFTKKKIGPILIFHHLFAQLLHMNYA